MSTMPQQHLRRNSATIPATTKITASSHRMKVTVVPFLSLAWCAGPAMDGGFDRPKGVAGVAPPFTLRRTYPERPTLTPRDANRLGIGSRLVLDRVLLDDLLSHHLSLTLPSCESRRRTATLAGHAILEPLHQDALRLPDDVPGVDGSLQVHLVVASRRSPPRHGRRRSQPGRRRRHRRPWPCASTGSVPRTSSDVSAAGVPAGCAGRAARPAGPVRPALVVADVLARKLPSSCTAW